MKQIVRFLSVLCFLLLINSNLFAYVGYDCKVDGIYYKRISTDEFEVAPKEVKDEWGSWGSKNNADAYTGNVTIPSSVIYNGRTFKVTGIGDFAFYYCSMTSITIPSSVKTIGRAAFNSSKLSSFNYLGDLSTWCKIKFRDNVSNPTEITRHLFINGKEIRDLIIPDDVTTIGDYAFKNCLDITSVTIPSHVTSIGDAAFEHCSNIKHVNLSNNLSSIGNNVFADCTSLTSITIPNSVTSIGSNAFHTCTSLMSIKLPNSLTYIANHTFCNCTSLKEINIPSGCSLGQGAFQGCTSLKSIDIPRKISYDVCKGCSSLEKVIIRSSSDIGNSAFSGTTVLSSIYIYSKEPPYIQPETFDDYHFVWTDLYVPKGAKDAYKKSKWRFVSIIEFDTTGIDAVNDEGSNESVSYNLEGHKIAEPERGVNIIKMNDGTTRKFVVK